MEFRFSPEDDAFRAEIRAFLEAEWPGGTGDASVDSDEEYAVERAFERKLAERGWLTMAWPPEYGGLGATNVRQAIMKEECTYFRAPYGGGPGAQATGLVGPAVMAHGTDEQKRRFLPPIARGEHYWCQGFSEPNAGSDLASVQTRAERDGDDYVINGAKTWTSGAKYADWIHLLARTDPEAPKHKGLSYFLIDMKSPGISYRPIEEMTGRAGFYDTFFENVRVPRANLLGEENRGWYVATTTLSFERSGIQRIGAIWRWFDELVAEVGIRNREYGTAGAEAPGLHSAGQPLSGGSGFNLTGGAGGRSDTGLRARLAEHRIELEVGRWLAYRVAWMQDRGETPNHEASQSKTFATEIAQRFANTAVNALGLGGGLTQFSRGAPVEGRHNFMYLLTAHWTISAGTSEIQRNIIAQRGLGLPRD
jgi:alkylation response protein AidB-like acyl-CoA dehydrogenase